MVRDITPFMYRRRRFQAELRELKKKRHTAATGLPVPQRRHVPLAYFEPNETLGSRGKEMVWTLKSCSHIAQHPFATATEIG